MTIYNVSAIDTIAGVDGFVPYSDVIFFDNPGDEARFITLFDFGGNLGLFPEDGPTANTFIVVDGLAINQIRAGATPNVKFASGSQIFAGDLYIGTANDDNNNTHNGTEQGDLFIGLGGNDNMKGNGGDDVFLLDPGGMPHYGIDTINGGAGSDWVKFADLSEAGAIVDLTLATGTLSGGYAGGSARVTSVENVLGTSFNDSMTGNASANWFIGRSGNDSLRGAAGADRLDGDDGNDTLDGGAGVDTVDYSEDPEGVIVNLATGTATDGFGIDTMVGGSDSLVSIENVLASAFADTITGSAVANTIDCGAGADIVHAGGGNDTVIGGGGVDQLWGQAGNDSLSGGDSGDRFWAGAGLDILVLGNGGTDLIYFDASPVDANADTISGFVSGQDKLRFDDAKFTQLGAPGAFTVSDERFYSASDANAALETDDRMIYNTADGKLYYDADGSLGGSTPQLIATFSGLPVIVATDIIVY